MKIAMLLDNPFISDKRVYKEAKSLADNGYDVTVICQKPFDHSSPDEEVIDGIKVRRLFHYNLGTTVQVEKYLQANIELFNNLKERFDVYHCHDTETWPIGYLLSQRDNAGFICDSHEFFPDYIYKEWHNDQFKYELTKMLVNARGNFIKYAHKTIVVGEKIADELMNLYNLKERPTVIYNTRALADKNSYKHNKIREVYGISLDYKVLLSQGIVEPSRGLDIAIACMKYIDNAVLVIAGQDRGEYAEELRKLAEGYGVDKRVIFTGKMAPDELLEYSSYADALIFFGKPSVKNMEYCMPNKIFDYIFAEKPMILSDLLSLKQLVTKYEIGELIDIHNIDILKISDVIKDVINNQEKSKRYIENMRKIQPIFSWEEQERKLIQIYNELKDNKNNLEMAKGRH